MIYYYSVRLCFWKNNDKILKDYRVSFVEIVNFLYEMNKKYSSMEIYWIKPYYRKGCDYFD